MQVERVSLPTLPTVCSFASQNDPCRNQSSTEIPNVQENVERPSPIINDYNPISSSSFFQSKTFKKSTFEAYEGSNNDQGITVICSETRNGPPLPPVQRVIREHSKLAERYSDDDVRTVVRDLINFTVYEVIF